MKVVDETVLLLLMVMMLAHVASPLSLQDFQRLLRDDCIAKVGERGGYWISTFQDSLSLFFAVQKGKDLEITLQQGAYRSTKQWTPPAAEQKWYRGNLTLSQQPVLLTENENISFVESPSSMIEGTKWDIHINNVDYFTECPRGLPVIEIHHKLGFSKVVIPQSGRDTEELQFLPLQDTEIRMTVGGVEVKVCREGEGSVVVKKSDPAACPDLQANEPFELQIKFNSDTVQVGMEKNMSTFNYAGAKTVMVDKDVKGSVYIIQCLSNCPIPVPTDDNDTTLYILIPLVVIFASSTLILCLVLICKQKNSAPSYNMQTNSDTTIESARVERRNSLYATFNHKPAGVEEINDIYEPYIPGTNREETVNDIYESYDQIAS